ncbi:MULTISPECIES: MFS transporter [unclassified Pseudomonas]|uniref:MFS transporter n=1 Tax=unclassified Pseudomonas TaxID=196821 RepID=UPI000D3675B3|nr:MULTISPECIES: MFS transporter [unclassified Pseudomonas]RAU48023.1 MFS transporter [Pseudomonas sp. RIT 409]RAU55283.1 MFS transporter [Pseudomonas sp. RIT 412]
MNNIGNAAMADTPPTSAVHDTRSIRKVVWAGAIGTLIEYYDYTAYAFLATTLAALFFPADEPLALLYTFAVFGVAFVVRPIGGILLGALADKVGRKPALLVSVVGMVGATACIGLLPTYAAAGIAAPVLLCLLRCIQGMAAGGEMGGAVTYVAEVAPDAKRAALTSTTQIGCLVGTMGGAIAVALLNMLMTHEQLLDWGWRLPFLISAPMGIIALMIRHKMEETPDFVKLERQNKVKKAPTLILLRRYPGPLLAIACIGSCAMAGYYLPFTYLVTYFQQQGIMTAQMAGWSATLSMTVAALAIYPFGLLSDKIGRRPMLIGVTLCFMVFTYPLFLAMKLSVSAAMASQVALGLLEAAYLSTNYTLYCELLPTSVRTSGINLGISIAAIAAGGSAPYIATWLMTYTGSPTSPAWILIIAGLISFLVLLRLKETAGRPLAIE